jgi:N-carbamoylputrescine amidase
MQDIRIALIVCHSSLEATELNFQRMSAWVDQAARQNARLVCFPELNISGYTVRTNGPAAELLPGRISRRLGSLAKKSQMAILAGMAEKTMDGQVYAVHLIARPDGAFGIYRKLHIAPPEKGVFAAGNQVPLFDVFGVRVGIQLCYDTHFPELSTLMAAHGAELIVMPHASPRGTSREKYQSWKRHLPARAYDNSLYVVACNQTGDNGEGLVFPGVAMMIGPSGNVMQKDVSGGEGMLVADLSAKELNRVRHHPMHYFFANRRPGLYENAFRQVCFPLSPDNEPAPGTSPWPVR